MTQGPPPTGPIDPRGTTGGMPAPGAFPPNAPQQGAPYPPMYPQQMFYPPPPPPPPRSGGFAKAVLNTLAVSILGFSVSLNIYFLVYSVVTSGSDAHIQSTTVQDGDEKNRIAILPVTGVIMDNTVQKFDAMLDKVESDSTIRALIIEVDTPGGGVTASDEIYNRIVNFKKKTNINVVITMKSMATSGGYYISCAGDHIIAERTTITGNIGVIMSRLNFAGLGEKYGVEDTTLVSTGAIYKDAGSAWRKETPEQTAYIRGLLDDSFTTFKSVVTTGRGTHLTKTITEIANGKAYTGNEALQLGLVDQIGYPEDGITAACKLAGLGTTIPEVIRYEIAPTLSEKLFGGAQGKSGMSGVSASFGKAEVKIDNDLIQDLMTSRPMYIWRGE